MPARTPDATLAPRPSWLLIHGLGDNAHVWDSCRANLVGVGAIARDLAGHGKSRWRPDGAYRIESYASELLPLLTNGPATRWVVAGHSLGALVAAAIAARASRQIAGLVLVEPAEASRTATTARIREDLRRLCATRFASKADYAAELAARHPLASAPQVERYAAKSLRRSRQGDWRVAFDPRILDFDLVEDVAEGAGVTRALAALDCPIMLVRGAGSAALSRSAAEDLAARLGPHCELETVPRAGHAVPLDNPAALAAALDRFAAVAL